MAGGSTSLSNNEALDSHINQGSSYQQKISGIQGMLNVPAFPFTNTGAGGVVTDLSSDGGYGLDLSGFGLDYWLLIGGLVVVVYLGSKRG